MTAGRSDRLAAGLVFLVLAVWPSGRPAAQVSVRLSLGGRYSTALVRDSIVAPIELRPGISPVLQLSVRDELRGPWTGDLTLDLSPTPLHRRESGSTADAGSFTSIGLTLGLRRTMHAGVAARLGVGGVLYATDNTGVFRQGSGVFPLIALGASYAPPVGARHGFEVGLSYDVHRFITPALRSVGFNAARPAHRVALTVSARLLGR